MPIQTIHHNDTRAHIPSKEEAGYESGNPKTHKQKTELPLNPVTTRGKDPELYWLGKYGPDDAQEQLQVDIRSLYRHEHIVPENLIKGLYKATVPTEGQQLSLNELFGNALERDELNKTGEYYQQPPDGWSNRLIQGDSSLVMGSLLEREGMAEAVQCVYFDPPYGIKYGSNWQIQLNNRSMPSSEPDESLSGEPEQIKAFRDTWELGIHSYLSYLRERLLLARELLTESGSCFVQISDENMHLVRCLMDEVFGSENFVATINFKTRMPLESGRLESVFDYVIWYAKKKEVVKYKNLFVPKQIGDGSEFVFADTKDDNYRKLTKEERQDIDETLKTENVFKRSDLASSGYTASCIFDINFSGRTFRTSSGKSWRTTRKGVEKLTQLNRLFVLGDKLYYKMYVKDFPFASMTNTWHDTIENSSREYVVQTTTKVIQRCLLMCTDPGDLVLDPTCGSGTSAYVAEQWGRRWITIDTSRIAINIAKTRLMTAVFPAYRRVNDKDIRHGFIYKTVPHITLGSLANDEPAETETLYDKPEVDTSRFRVAGPFTVETLQSLDPVAPPAATDATVDTATDTQFAERVYEMLRSAGIRNGDATERAVFRRVEPIVSDREGQLHAEGFYVGEDGQERKAYIHVGPKFGAVSKQALNNAVKETRGRGDADWLVILGFQFETDVKGSQQSTSMGQFRVDIVRMNDDLMQDGLMKKDKKAAAFVTIGEPDIAVVNANGQPHKGKATVGQEVRVEVRGLDLYDPIKDEVKARNVQDIAYWMVDDDYDGSNFVVKQVFFCGGDHDEFNKWRKGLSDTAKLTAKKRAEHTLRVEIDEEAFDGLYGFRSHPVRVARAGQQIAVRVVSQFGEESTKVLGV
jgi:adenine-specific DNA-methyltransferase